MFLLAAMTWFAVHESLLTIGEGHAGVMIDGERCIYFCFAGDVCVRCLIVGKESREKAIRGG